MKTHEQFLKQVYDLVENEYEVLGVYKKYHSKVLMKHNICGNEYEVRPSGFISGRRCPKCKGGMKKTDKDFKQQIYDLVGDEYIFIEKYINAKTPIKYYHSVCKTENKVSPDAFLQGCRCSYCNGGVPYSHEDFVKRVKEVRGDEYEVLGKYLKSTTKVLMKHNVCSKSFEMQPNNFLQGQSCTHCRKSKGEQALSKYFDENNIKNEPQYVFEDLVSELGNPLRFDFGVLCNNGNLVCLVEFDGIFHFKKQYCDDGFEQTQHNDQIKNQYCINNNIKLLRIPYWDFDNINVILDKYLLQFDEINQCKV